MIDSVLKGTGNSRFLKSAVPAGTSWADALAMLQAGTFPIDFNGINNAGFQQVGTPLNKANLLKDATALTLGLTGDATPNDMFNVLAHAGDLHVWRKTVVTKDPVPAGYTLGEKAEVRLASQSVSNGTGTDTKVTVAVTDSITVSDSGVIIPGTTTEYSAYPGSISAGTLTNSAIAGKFIFVSAVGSYIRLEDVALRDIYYAPPDATMSSLTEAARRYLVINGLQKVTGYPATSAGTTTTYPVSTNPNAYQEGDDAKEAGYTLGEVVTGSFRAGATNYTISYNYEAASELTVSDDGRTVSMTSPSAGSFGFMGGLEPGDDPAKIRAFMLGKFVRCTAKGDQLNEAPDTKYPFNTIPSDIVYIPSSAQITMANGDVLVDRYQPVTGYAAIPANTTIEYLGKLGDKARVQVLSYIGTGTYGSSNPNSLTFDFIPKLFWISGPGYAYYTDMLVFYGDTNRSEGNSDYYFTFNNISWEGKKVSWYSESNTELQANIAGEKYTIRAIG